jgi:hypothetical protein
MASHSEVIAASIAGALLGGVAGYLLMSEQGRVTRRHLEQSFVDFVRELNELRQVIEDGAGVIVNAWTALNSIAGEGAREPRPYSERRVSAY